MKTYQEIKSTDPTLFECFFAFSNSQFDEGIKKHNLEGKKIYRGIGGLYGTQEGIAKLYADYDAQDVEVAENCNPQDVYNYEFDNHECSYTCDDGQAFAIVEHIFGAERSQTVKRRFKHYEQEDN